MLFIMYCIGSVHSVPSRYIILSVYANVCYMYSMYLFTYCLYALLLVAAPKSDWLIVFAVLTDIHY